MILFGRNHNPVGDEVRAVLGIRGEPGTPEEPAQGMVWQSIVAHLNQSRSQNEFVSVTNIARETFAKHPWSIGGGGVTELKQIIEKSCLVLLGQMVESVGRTTVVGEDDCWIFDLATLHRLKVFDSCLPFGIGENIRDWGASELPFVIYPYVEIGGKPISSDSYVVTHYLWHFRTLLRQRTVFGKSLSDQERPWFEHLEHYVSKLRTSLSIAFAEIATHNHFVLDRGGKVFNRSAPIIKLPSNTTQDDHLALLSLLNSSVACFWAKQVFHNKGSTVDNKGARQTTIAFENFYDFTGTGLQKFPVTSEQPLDLALSLDRLAQNRQRSLPTQLAANFPLPRTLLEEHRNNAAALLGSMIALQEELDWRCYTLYGVTDEDLCYHNTPGKQLKPPGIKLGQRAFEIVMARKMAAGELETTWFERHGSTPVTEISTEWPEDYRKLIERRIELIETNHNIFLIEQPEYKRRWNTEPWDQQLQRALRTWLLDRLESAHYWPDPTQTPELTSCTRLAERAARDADFLQVAALYRGREDFDVLALVNELVASEAVPFLPVLRYKPSGLTLSLIHI